MSRKSHKLLTLVLGASSLNGCVTTNLYDYCSFGDLAGANPESLGVLLAAPADRFNDSSFIMLYTPSETEPVSTLKLALEPARMLWPQNLDETPCRGVDWRTFRVETDSDQWAEFWALPRPLPVKWGFGFLNSMEPLPISEIAVAMVDVATGETLMSCGCYGI